MLQMSPGRIGIAMMFMCVGSNGLASQQCKSPDSITQARWRQKHSASLDTQTVPGKIVIESVNTEGLFKVILNRDGVVERVQPLEAPTHLSQEYETRIRPLVSQLKAGKLRDPAQAVQFLAGFEKSDETLYVHVLNNEYPFPDSAEDEKALRRGKRSSESAALPSFRLVQRMKRLVNSARRDLRCPQTSRT